MCSVNIVIISILLPDSLEFVVVYSLNVPEIGMNLQFRCYHRQYFAVLTFEMNCSGEECAAILCRVR